MFSSQQIEDTITKIGEETEIEIWEEDKEAQIKSEKKIKEAKKPKFGKKSIKR